jgi:hypothetical protein
MYKSSPIRLSCSADSQAAPLLPVLVPIRPAAGLPRLQPSTAAVPPASSSTLSAADHARPAGRRLHLRGANEGRVAYVRFCRASRMITFGINFPHPVKANVFEDGAD